MKVKGFRVIQKCGSLTSDIAPYYFNPYTWCKGQCCYCWGYHWKEPNKDREDTKWIKVNDVKLLEEDLKNNGKLNGNLWIGNFADAYQPIEREYQLTRKCIKIANDYGQKITILTKFGSLAMRDLDLEIDEVGISLISLDDSWRRKYEPFSDSARDRIDYIVKAKEIGIKTFVNVEPLLRLEDFYAIYQELRPIVDRFLVGKLNPRQKDRIDFAYPDYEKWRSEISKYNVIFKVNWR